MSQVETLARFMALKADFDVLLKDLSTRSEAHFGLLPDWVKPSDVDDLEQARDELERVALFFAQAGEMPDFVDRSPE